MKEQVTKLKNKNILVTGGAGVIGSNLCETLLQIGAKVTCLDNFATGHQHNITPFLEDSSFTSRAGDIRSLNTCHSACNGHDYVLPQAALASVARSPNDPITTNDADVAGFLRMLVAARGEGVKR